MQRLRPLSDDECYARLYGRSTESAVNLVRSESARPPIDGPSGESLRRFLEASLELREGPGAEEAA